MAEELHDPADEPKGLDGLSAETKTKHSADPETKAKNRAREAEAAQNILLTIMENAPIGITLALGPPDFPIVANSKEASRLIGKDGPALLNIAAGFHMETYGLRLPDGTIPRPEQLPLYRASHFGEVIKDEEWIIDRADGRRVYECCNVAPIRDSQGQIIGAINCWYNITERKRAEEQMRTLASLVENSHDFIGISSPAGEVIFVNPAGQKLLGLNDSHDVRETRIFDYVDQKSRHLLEQEVIPAVNQHGQWHGELAFRNFQNGLSIPMLCNVFFIKEPGTNRPVALATISRDITERRWAEEKLKRSEAYLAEGERLSHTASWAWNVSSGEVFWSAELFRIYGLDADEMKPGYPNVLKYIHPDDRSRAQSVFEDAVRDKKGYELSYRVVRGNGTVRHVHNIAHPVFENGGALTEYVGTTIDTTERIHAEEALFNLQTELAHVVRITTIGELAASLAHELNQPLGAIVNNANVCLRSLGRSARSKDLLELLADIVSDANRASSIISRLRALIKRSLPEKNVLSIEDIIDEVLILTHRQLKECRIEVRKQLPKDLPEIIGDRVQLQQVFLNLIVNAIEAMSEVPDDRRKLSIRGQRSELFHEPAVLIGLKDCGEGIKPGDEDRLFEAFYTTKAEALGHGPAN